MVLGTLGKLVRKKKGSKSASSSEDKKGQIADNSIQFHRNNRRNPASLVVQRNMGVLDVLKRSGRGYEAGDLSTRGLVHNERIT